MSKLIEIIYREEKVGPRATSIDSQHHKIILALDHIVMMKRLEVHNGPVYRVTLSTGVNIIVTEKYYNMILCCHDPVIEPLFS